MKKNKRFAERKKILVDIEFFINADIIDAKSINISNIGIQFQTKTPISVLLRIKEKGHILDQYAKLVWSKKKESAMNYGFEFIDSSCTEIF